MKVSNNISIFSKGEGLASCVLRARGEILAGASVALQNPSRASVRAVCLGVGSLYLWSQRSNPVIEVKLEAPK